MDSNLIPNITNISSLDDNALLYIFGHVYVNPLPLLLVCNRWNSLMWKNDSYWRILSYRRWTSLNLLPNFFPLTSANRVPDWIALRNSSSQDERETKRRKIIRQNDDNNQDTFPWRNFHCLRHIKLLGFSPSIKKASQRYATSLNRGDLNNLLQIMDNVKQAASLTHFLRVNTASAEEQFIADSVLYSKVVVKSEYRYEDIDTGFSATFTNEVEGSLMDFEGNLRPFNFQLNVLVPGGHWDGNTEYEGNQIRIGGVEFPLRDMHNPNPVQFNGWLLQVQQLLKCSAIQNERLARLLSAIMIPSEIRNIQMISSYVQQFPV
jgi:hypothetical protein